MLSGLSAISYTVRVRNDVSGCVSSADYRVSSNLSSPVVDVEEVNSGCVVYCWCGWFCTCECWWCCEWL